MKKHMLYFAPWFAFSFLLLITTLTLAGDEIRVERITFSKGTNSAVVEARIQGYETVDYVLNAKAGQSINVSLATKHTATYFNIIPPGETDVALFNSSMSENQYEGVLPDSGDYKIRVYMMRSAARRNEVASYRLEVIVGHTKQSVNAVSHDAKVAGTDFHATGNLPCTINAQPNSACAFGVKRQGNGNAEVVITKPDKTQRIIFFEKGYAVSYNKNQTDTNELKTTKESDLNIINIGQERYEIPDAVISGG